MKKGMCVTLEDNKEYVLVDNVVYDGEKFFAAVLNDDDVTDMEFFKEVITEDGEYLENISRDNYPHIIDALLRHIADTFNDASTEAQN